MNLFWKFKINPSILCIWCFFTTNHSVKSSLHQDKTLEHFRLMSSELASKTEKTKNGER